MINVSIKGGPAFQVNWVNNITIHDVLEEVYNSVTNKSFTYSLQYYGSGLGYLVNMINETYDSFNAQLSPFFFWEVLVDNEPIQKGIDNTTLDDGNTVSFTYIPYVPELHKQSTLSKKFASKTGSFSEN